MFRKSEGARGSQVRQKRNQQKISKMLQQTSSKRKTSDNQGLISQHNNKSKRRRPPSEEALQLSDRLKKLSREKKLDEALAVFWDSSNNKIRDGHHACIMVDMAARCGKIAEGEILLEKVGKKGIFISVETKTALLKVSSDKMRSISYSSCRFLLRMTCSQY